MHNLNMKMIIFDDEELLRGTITIDTIIEQLKIACVYYDNFLYS